ncbi:NagC family transcriptional regulator [Bifidobacterium pseudolongum subsp. globosum]|uniref:NagC family transcriptional regulator n=1 Tax=Bifidobacterium pseudolongum subsp. globosum TaxID=1690 RepID=A0A4Q5AM17_9BIFI|nr:ROK family transcriptional regulator [Bifidobacterium pseudolongum]RYQ22405.1 NagC family transcriptional regulator [Bifidobacterium pseudolongum subsp. globosum]RYQ30742.1 NagC family transcriptional regulator [Bifidobacterium pseudolongum subsp. globosum]
MAALKRINQDDLRNHNLSVVLNTMLRSTSAFSRADLAKETGLTKATMSLLVSMLIEHRIVKEGAPLVQSVYGRPSTPLNIAGGSVCGIGIQINTDGYGYIVLDLDGSVVAERWIAHDLHDADADALFGELDVMLSEQEKTLRAQNYRIAGVGLALPGLVTEDGHLLMARNLGWEDLDLSRFDLIRHFDVTVANESNMAAVAQLPGYATQRTDEGIVGPNGSFLYVSTDIGIGGAIVRAGRVVTGDHGFAGEIGHLSVQMDGPVCRCGRRGCVEAYAGRRSMVEAAGVATGNDAASLEAIDEFTRRVEAGDPVATAVFADAGDAMASMLTSVINLADLDTVIIGGNWSRVPADVLARMAARIQERILARGTLNVRLLRASGISRPALFGAAQTGLRNFIDDPLRYLG